jgi:hypothetical protein
MLGLYPPTTDHAGRFNSGLGWFCSFQSQLATKQRKQAHKFFDLWSSAALKGADMPFSNRPTKTEPTLPRYFYMELKTS